MILQYISPTEGLGSFLGEVLQIIQQFNGWSLNQSGDSSVLVGNRLLAAAAVL